MLHAADDVATALRDLAAGEVVEVRIGDRAERVTLAEPIALCHKFALHALSPGQEVRKYGEVIGRATAAVERGRLGPRPQSQEPAGAPAGGLMSALQPACPTTPAGKGAS